MNTNIKHIHISLIWLLMISLVGCYKDKGNYEYEVLPEAIVISTDSYATLYQKNFISDYLEINPEVSYDGEAADLSYEWQIWNSTTMRYLTLSQGKNLNYKLGADDFVMQPGTYYFRLSVKNNKLISSTTGSRETAIYSRLITVNVLANNFLGLMVLHGNEQESDVGLIQNNLFLSAAGTTVNTHVNPNFYSFYNDGTKLKGAGIQVVATHIPLGVPINKVYVATKQEHWMTNMQTLAKESSYSEFFAVPTAALGSPNFFVQFNSAGRRGLVDNGKLFYGNMIGALENSSFNYEAEPYIALVNVSFPVIPVPVGVVVFDKLSKSFLYSGNGTNANLIERFPENKNAAVNMDPNQMKASLVYLESRLNARNSIAVMKDDVSGDRYLGEFNFGLADKSRVALGRYEMKDLPGYSDMKYYAFGSEINMNYYATSSKIYKYLYASNNVIEQYSIPSGESITMMKLLKFNVYQHTNKVMVVGTVDAQGKGKLYAFTVDTINGEITFHSVYSGFDRIYDANIKNQ